MMKVSKARVARVRRGFRQLDLAEKVGVSTSLISLFENEDRKPSSALAAKLNEVLGEKVYEEILSPMEEVTENEK